MHATFTFTTDMQVNQCLIFRAPSVFYFSDVSYDPMLFLVFLSCIPIMVIIFQVKSLMATGLLNL